LSDLEVKNIAALPNAASTNTTASNNANSKDIGSVFMQKFDANHNNTLESNELEELNKLATLSDEEIVKQGYNIKDFKKYFKAVIDGNTGTAKQSTKGDCWILSGANSLSQSQKGLEIIKNAIKRDEKGNILVELKGAQKTYTLTPEEIEDRKKDLSTGDDDMRAIEIAVEKYRKSQNNKRGIDAGSPTELAFLLTGKKGKELYPYLPSMEEFKAAEKELNWTSDEKKDFIKLITEQKPATKEEINSYLNQIKTNPKKYASTIVFNQQDRYVKNQHLYNIVEIKDQTVVLQDPGSPTVKREVPKEELTYNMFGLGLFNPEEK
jgi:hypothetical protein